MGIHLRRVAHLALRLVLRLGGRPVFYAAALIFKRGAGRKI